MSANGDGSFFRRRRARSLGIALLAKGTSDPILAVFLSLFASAGLGQPVETPEAGDWPLEEVRTHDGHVYHGLIRGEQDGELEFVEVVRPRGRGMFFVVRPIPKDAIQSTTRLSEPERNKLAARIYAFRWRARIEAGRMDDVKVVERMDDDDQRQYLRYRGPWFTLDSTADEELTRRCVVRIEQIFRAYRQILPPRVESARPLRIVLFGSLDDFAAFLRKHELEDVANPAIFSQQGNLIVSGSELAPYAQRLRIARRQHEAIRQQYNEAEEALPDQLAELSKKLAAAGVGEDAIKAERNARLKQWNTQRDLAMTQLNAADRRNDAAFAEVTAAMFRRLYHEGFHAYLENYVYPHEQFDVPLWLHEGLAQVFQNGRLEADTLRIDAPLPDALANVQADLRSDAPLLIEEVVSARRSDFLGRGDQRHTDRLYAHAWALAYYLTFYEPVLGTAALDAYVSPEAARLSPPARLEKLLGMPIPEFEEAWLRTILNLKPPR